MGPLISRLKAVCAGAPGARPDAAHKSGDEGFHSGQQCTRFPLRLLPSAQPHNILLFLSVRMGSLTHTSHVSPSFIIVAFLFRPLLASERSAPRKLPRGGWRGQQGCILPRFPSTQGETTRSLSIVCLSAIWVRRFGEDNGKAHQTCTCCWVKHIDVRGCVFDQPICSQSSSDAAELRGGFR